MYNALPDLLIFGALLLTMAAVILWPRKQRGATPASKPEIIKHQLIRRMENGH